MNDAAAAKKTVLVSSLALVFIALYRDRTGTAEVDLYKRVWGVGVLAVMLGLAADFAPKVAGPFALLVVLGAMTNGGDRALVNLLAGVRSGGAARAGDTGRPPGVQGPVGNPTAAGPARAAPPPGLQGPPGTAATASPR